MSIKNPEGREQQSRESERQLRIVGKTLSMVWKVIVATVAVAGLLTALATLNWWPFQQRPASVEILSLNSGQMVLAILDSVSGSSVNVPDEEKIWLVVEPQGTGALFPQNGPVSVRSNGDWFSPPVYVGVEADSGREFDVLAVTVNNSASDEFVRYLERGKQTGVYAGLPQLPPGAVERDRITVMRE